jgi:uncharacterized protein (DUF58 family)
MPSSASAASEAGPLPRARTTVLLGVALLLAAAAVDSPSLYVPGVGLLLLALGAVAWVELAARGVRVHRDPGPSTGIEGETYPLHVRLERGRVPLPGGELRDPALETALAVRPGAAGELRASIRLGRRGRRVLAPTTLLLRDPLGLHARELTAGRPSDVLVLPLVEPVIGAKGGGARSEGRLDGAAGDGEAGERRASRRVAPSSDVDGLRPHQDGAPASRIHWPTAARTGELFDRRLVTGAESPHVVVLDVGGGGDKHALDRAVRAAGSLARHLAPAGGCALFLPGEQRPFSIGRRLDGWPRAHVALALVQAWDGPVAARTSNGGLTVWVSSGTEALGGTELVALGRRATHVVVPTELPGLRAELTVAGCNLYPLRGAARRAAPGAAAAA